MKRVESKRLFEEARKCIVGGVNSPVRAFKSVGGDPLFISMAKGSRVYDEDGNEFIDYVCSYGPVIVGHANDEVLDKAMGTMRRGLSFGAPTRLETELAKRIVGAFDSLEMLRFVNSGTEATMSAIRLARGVTKRDNILKFSGCYHGHSDALLVASGSGAATFGKPTSEGVPYDFVRHTFVVEYNDVESVGDVFRRYGDTIACAIVEPIPGNMGLVKPKDGFLDFLRKITREYESLLIFDEVMSGFRITYGGAEHLFGIKPDIVTLGKVIGGGMPVAVYGSSEEIMAHVSPEGGVYQAGTLSGNPVAMACGVATLDILKEENPYEDFRRKTETLVNGVEEIARERGIPVSCTCMGSMFSVFFSDKEPASYSDVLGCDVGMFSRYFRGMLDRGVYLPPSQFETNFVSMAHADEDIAVTLEKAREVMGSL